MNHLKLATSLAALSLMTGCALPVSTAHQAQEKMAERLDSEFKSIANQSNRAAVRVVGDEQPQFTKKLRPKAKGDLNAKAASAPVGPLLTEFAKKAGYNIAFAEGVDTHRAITVDFNNAMAEDAIRTTAFLAGYVAIFNKERRQITVAESATFTFKLPPSAMSALKAEYKAGNSESSGGSSSGPSSALTSQFMIEGSEGPDGSSLSKLIADTAGPNANVSVSPLGYVTVRGSATGLSRVDELVKRLAREALTQVDIEASIVEVELTREFSYGISWDRVLQRASGSEYTLGITASESLGVPGLTMGRTSANTKSILTALERFTDVRVVSQPRLVAMNNTPSNFVEATQIPYLGSVSQTAASTAGGEPTVSGELSFAIDGVTFSAVPSVIDSNQVQISLMPVIDTVGEFSKFDLGSTKLEAPRSGKKQTFMRVIAESGKTLILGGIRVGTDRTTTTVPSSTVGARGSKEIVVLLRANIVEPRPFEAIVAESM